MKVTNEDVMNAAGRGLGFIPLRRCSICNEYIGYRFVRVANGDLILCLDSGCGCGRGLSPLQRRPIEEVVDRFNNLIEDGLDLDEEEEDFVVSIMEYL